MSKRKETHKTPEGKAAQAAPTPVTPTSPIKKQKMMERSEYGWREVHKDIQAGNTCGVYGSCHAPYHGLAGLRAGVDMRDFHKKKHHDEVHLQDIVNHIKKESVQACWDGIFTLDPLGMLSQPPTMSATEFHMRIPEIDEQLRRDGQVVIEDGRIRGSKVAIDMCWNLPLFATRVGLKEKDIRKALADYTQNPNILDESKRAYFPPVGGATAYIFGDIKKLGDPTTPLAVRVHDQCTGSDVFGTDICTCRPYLVFAIQAAVECAQKGGVGLVVYYQKEGRSLGEVTKYRVYNARKAQEGGDRPEKYFYQTESIAGIRDARFQEMMPDVLLWLGVRRITYLLSMSSEKYDAITAAGIEVMQRVSLPDDFVPESAGVEITAKIASGYHTDIIDTEDTLNDLRQLATIRKRCGAIFDLAKKNRTIHFKLHLDKLPSCVDFVLKIIKEGYPKLDIPFHSRWRHFDQKRLDNMYKRWHCDEKEKARRQIDLVTVSVLLDAGSGGAWSFHDPDAGGEPIGRSEGLAIATQVMFTDGLFSSDLAMPSRVNSLGLSKLTLKEFAKAFQHSEQNKLVGLKERLALMRRLGAAMRKNPTFFGKEISRPGHIVDYVLAHVKDNRVHINVLWKAVIEGLESIWPENISGVRRGDVWAYSPLKEIGTPASDMVPFHKLSQWLTYSLLEPFMETLGISFDGLELLTGLAEYRNGGLFVDFGVLTPRDKDVYRMKYDVGSELVIEWRALTLCLLDETAKVVREKLNLSEEEMPLAKVLQGGTWTAGRAIAAQKRPETKAPPIQMSLKGNVF